MSNQYEQFLEHVLTTGVEKGDRTETGTISVFGHQMRFDLSEGFPLITTKKIYTRGVVGELIWMLKGDTNVKWLQDNNIHIWDEWADENGNLGPVYGAQWRSWPHSSDGYNIDRSIDQILGVIQQIRKNPDSRRLVVSAWNPSDLEDMKLPPCHMMFQFYVVNGKLSCQLYQRSADIFLGVPFNIASYALLTHMIAQQTGLEVGDFIWTGGDCHIYLNHLEQVKEQLTRVPRPYPKLIINKRDNIDDYEIDDVAFEGYMPHPAIKAPVAV